MMIDDMKYALLTTLIIAAVAYMSWREGDQRDPLPRSSAGSTVPEFSDTFDEAYTIQESSKGDARHISSWRLTSGAYFYSGEGIAHTALGSLSADDPWRIAFSNENATDTDDGYHPQNIFRLVQEGQWENFQQEVYFRIKDIILSESANRNASNGLFLFNRYQDASDLYYAGVRVDGYAVIKKKFHNIYYTMAYEPFFMGPAYDREINPNALPEDTWIGVRSAVQTNSDGSVAIRIYIDEGKTGNWVLAAEAVDDGVKYGGEAILSAGNGGIRTDFMDVYFSGYAIKEVRE